jgi:hypothetical protein
MRSFHSPREPDPVIVTPRPLVGRVFACLFGASLDAALASGNAPESAWLLAVRAQEIVSLPKRTATAENWEHLLRVARRPAAKPSTPCQQALPAALPIRAKLVVTAEPSIRELISRLSAPLPVPARGVAMARLLLTDATGPVYNRRSGVSLTDAIEAAIVQLDPALPLEYHKTPR